MYLLLVWTIVLCTKKITDVLNVIHCGVDESKVIRVALKDCEIIENEEAKELWKYREIGTVEECREAVEKQKAKKCVEESCPDHMHYKCPSCGKVQKTNMAIQNLDAY